MGNSWKHPLRVVGRVCHYCGAPATTRDHVVPKSMGGGKGLYNLTPACQPCNLAKGDSWPTCECFRCRRAVMSWIFRTDIEETTGEQASWAS